MQNSYRNLSSWREQTVEIKGGVTDVDFIDTKPNMFVVQNTSGNTVYIGLSSVPTVNNYEFKISPHTTCAIGRPLACTKLYIYQETNDVFPMKIWSIYDKFNMEILATTQVEMNDVTMETDGIIKGFAETAHLPSGDNKIGKVELTSDTLTALQAMFTNLSNASNVMWNKLMSATIQDDITNLASIVQALSDTVDKILKVEQVEVQTGIAVKTGLSNTTFSTNNAWLYWKTDGNGCVKVSDFVSETETNVSITANYDGTLTTQSAVIYFMLTPQSDNKVILAMRNDNEQSYPQISKTLTGFKDANETMYIKSTEFLAELAKYVATVYPPTTAWELISGLQSISFSDSKQLYTYEEESSQAYNQYSGAFSGIQKGVNIPSVYNGMYTVADAVGVNICSPITSESNPVKIMDRLEIFTNNSQYDMEIKIYYTFADYLIFKVGAGDYLSDLNIPTYNIGVKCPDVTDWSGKTAQFSIYGGLF